MSYTKYGGRRSKNFHDFYAKITLPIDFIVFECYNYRIFISNTIYRKNTSEDSTRIENISSRAFEIIIGRPLSYYDTYIITLERYVIYMYNCFRPGKEWLDTTGKPIQAHGGSIIFLNGEYYLYGENKEKTKPGSGIWHWGVRCYKSSDLYNWEDLGLICPPETEDDDNPLHYAQYLDRPHIIYNDKTQKFVMWIKIMNKQNLSSQKMYVAVSDKITGPYTKVKFFHPLGMSSGDFDLAKDEESGKAYIFFDRVHHDIICADLNEDYTDVTGTYTAHFQQPFCPLVREAPAFFKRNGYLYLATSGTTGYFPNPTNCYRGTDYHGPWEDLGYLHRGDIERLSFRSQISSVFKHPKKENLYIALADRWLVELPDNMPHNLFEIIISDCDETQELIIPKDEYERIKSYNNPMKRDLSIAKYVWLPIEFDGDTPYIKWYDEWRVEDFD